MNVLVACEESQTVCKAFRVLGHNAFSCDLQMCSGGHPEWHILGDVRDVLEPRYYGDPEGWFGHYETKRTCLWLKGLPKLRPTLVVRPNVIYLPNGKTDSAWHFYTRNSPDRQRLRSKTFSGIALAMASQWGGVAND